MHLPRPRRSLSWRELPWLMLQFLLVCSVELADDLIRGNLLAPNAALAQSHGRHIAEWEVQHGLLIEPSVQRALGMPLVSTLANTSYALLHLLVFALVLLWVYIAHRQYFSLFRATALLASAISVAIYELYPAAPPRLVTGLVVAGHPVHVADTASGLIGSGKLHVGTWAIGYNQYSAMPSLHIVWAILAAGTVALLATRSVVRAFCWLYPALMLASVIITGNHFVVDALVGTGVAASAAILTHVAFRAASVTRTRLARPSVPRLADRSGGHRQSAA